MLSNWKSRPPSLLAPMLWAMLWAVLCAALLGLCTQPAAASSRQQASALEMAQRSEAVIVARAVEVGKDTMRVSVLEVLKGAPVPQEIEVAPATMPGYMILTPTLKAGQEAILFLSRGKVWRKVWRIGDQGWDSIRWRTEDKADKADKVAGVKSLLALLAKKGDKASIDRAMLDWAASANQFLRTQSHRHIAMVLTNGKEAAIYKAQFLAMLGHPNADVRAVGLQALRFVPAEESLPLLIAATRDSDLRVVQNASMALARYDTPESAAALIALTRHASPEMRVRALIDLDSSVHPESKAALVALLDDPDPKVRALAPRGLVMWLRRKQANDIIPKLIAMLDDPVADVQSGAARELGESRDARALEPLLKVLERKDLGEDLEKWTVQALATLYSRIEAPERRIVDDKIELIIAALDRGRWLASLNAVGILAQSTAPRALSALRAAAKTHPLQDIREYAARSLPK